MALLNSREEYLKRYVDDPKSSKSKKKKRKSESCHKQSRFKIVDEDIDMKKIELSCKDDDESDEAPFVVSVIDERPEDVKVSEMYSSKLWKKLERPVKVKSEKLTESTELCNSSRNFSSDNRMEVQRSGSEDDLSTCRRSAAKMSSGNGQKLPRSKNQSVIRHDSESDISPPRVKNINASDSDISPPRVKNIDASGSDISTPRVKNINASDSDLSPPRSKINDHHHVQEYHSPSKSKVNYHHQKQDFSPSRNKVDNRHHHKKRDFSHSRSIDKTHDWDHAPKNFASPRSSSKDQHYKSGDFSPSRRKVDNAFHKQKDFSLSRSKTDSRHQTQKDFSPPRKAKKNYESSPDLSEKSRNQVHYNSDSDFSPPRKRTHTVDERRNFGGSVQRKKLQSKHFGNHIPSEYSSPLEKQHSKRMKKKHDSDSDNCSHSDTKHDSTNRKSVEKQHKKKMKKRHDSDSNSGSYSDKEHNLSKRKNVEKQHSKRTTKRHDSHSDKERNSSKRKNVDKQHSKRTRRRHDSHSDSSHSDKEQNSTKGENVSHLHRADSLMPVPKGKLYRMERESLHEPHTSLDSGGKERCLMSTLSGMKAGLQDPAGLQEEIRNFKRREKVALDELGDELSGRNAETISRDKNTGRRRNLKEERLKQKEKEEKNAEKLEKYLMWGKGLKQKDEQQKRLQEDMYEMSKPLARYADDDDLERQLKEDLKEGDPMLEYMKKKRQKSQLAVTSSLPVYDGPPAPPNRFNVPPGYRWDGVDRSNGFEKRFFEKINNSKATEHQAYLWSIENM